LMAKLNYNGQVKKGHFVEVEILSVRSMAC
jgi:hypothetical protein